MANAYILQIKCKPAYLTTQCARTKWKTATGSRQSTKLHAIITQPSRVYMEAAHAVIELFEQPSYTYTPQFSFYKITNELKDS
jgi:hypothetical protein